MSQWHRGGLPHHLNDTTPAAGAMSETYELPCETIRFLLQNTGATDLELFLTTKARDLGTGFGFTVPTGMGFTEDVEVSQFWVQSLAPTTFESLAIGRG